MMVQVMLILYRGHRCKSDKCLLTNRCFCFRKCQQWCLCWQQCCYMDTMVLAMISDIFIYTLSLFSPNSDKWLLIAASFKFHLCWYNYVVLVKMPWCWCHCVDSSWKIILIIYIGHTSKSDNWLSFDSYFCFRWCQYKHYGANRPKQAKHQNWISSYWLTATFVSGQHWPRK